MNFLSVNCRKQAEIEYNELKKQVEQLQMIIEQQRKNPTSEYDESITKQQYFNDTMRTQVICISNTFFPKKKIDILLFYFYFNLIQ